MQYLPENGFSKLADGDAKRRHFPPWLMGRWSQFNHDLEREIANFRRAGAKKRFRRRTTSGKCEEKISEVQKEEALDGWKRVEAAELEKYSG
jgi:hypothetical protein